MSRPGRRPAQPNKLDAARAIRWRVVTQARDAECDLRLRQSRQRHQPVLGRLERVVAGVSECLENRSEDETTLFAGGGHLSGLLSASNVPRSLGSIASSSCTNDRPSTGPAFSSRRASFISFAICTLSLGKNRPPRLAIRRQIFAKASISIGSVIVKCSSRNCASSRSLSICCAASVRCNRSRRRSRSITFRFLIASYQTSSALVPRNRDPVSRC